MSRSAPNAFTEREYDYLEDYMSIAIEVERDSGKFRPEDPEFLFVMKSRIGVEQADGLDAYDIWFQFTEEGRKVYRKYLADKLREDLEFDRNLVT